ncbi:MAG: LytTR family DNA-binding domain-containing protein [Lachnospiraceae bacterium]|nr:LytTR family DNA-binding domain-containing protein [Lachnospiraceae bacterium]
MIQIALCDDDRKVLDALEERIACYAKEKSVNLYINKFYRAEELETQLEKKKDYPIYFLDILMPDRDGIEIGKVIRKQDDQAVIIYLTSSADYALQAFGVFAQRYLLKPIQQREFEEAMDFAVRQTLQMQKVLHVNTIEGIRNLFYQEIEYIENVSRTLYIAVVNGEPVISRFLRKSFESDMEELLENENFIQVHKSFIVNLRYIKLYNQSQIVMFSDKVVPVSRSRQTEVKRIYLQYLSKRY